MAKIKVFATRTITEYGEVIIELSEEDEKYLADTSTPFHFRKRRLNKVYKSAVENGLVVNWERENEIPEGETYACSFVKE